MDAQTFGDASKKCGTSALGFTCINNYKFDSISSVNISLCDWVNDILCGVEHNLLIWGELLDQEVVADKLVVQDGCTELRAWSLHTISQFIVRANSIIAINNTLSLLIKTTEKVKGIEWHEATRVKCVTEKLSEWLNGWRLLESALISLYLWDQQLVQSLNIGNHTSWGDDALICEAGGLRVISC